MSATTHSRMQIHVSTICVHTCTHTRMQMRAGAQGYRDSKDKKEEGDDGEELEGTMELEAGMLREEEPLLGGSMGKADV